jgi:hypothetical protein
VSACALIKTYADTMNWPSTFDLCINHPSVPLCLPVGMNVWVKYGYYVHLVVEFSYMCWGKKIVKPLILVVLQTGTFFWVGEGQWLINVWNKWWKLTEDREEPCVVKYKTVKSHWTVAALLHWFWFHSENCKDWLSLKRGCKYACPPSCSH